MAKPGQQIQSALMRDPVSRPLPASTFRKTVAPPQRFAPPKNGGILESGGGQPQRVGIGQFEQGQFNRPVPPALPVSNDKYLKAPPPGYAAGIVGGMNPALIGQYQPGQVGIGQFEQSQYPGQTQPWLKSPMIGGSVMPTAPSYADQFNQTLTAPIAANAQQSAAMANANQFAQGAAAPIQSPAMSQAGQIAAGFGQGLMKR